MSRSRPNPRRRFVAALTPVVLALGALPLLAPTCGGSGGVQTFARNSLIIPMDLCYQSQSDGTTYTPFSCPQAADPGNVIRAYGLVYQLVRNNIAVYWIINPAKAALTDPDLTVQYSGGIPVFLYDWSTGGTGAAPTTAANSITYIGGPFVVDGSDYARASAVLQNYKNLYGTAPNQVNVHVSNVAFSANVAKTMAGGWSAGGAVPPKLALLDIGSSGAGTKNSEVVIQGYLAQAGLDFPGAAGWAAGPHGQIYDRLLMEDFWPDASGLPASSNLFKNGYQILWVPHWVAPNSCSDCTGTSCTCANKYTVAQVDTALKTMGAFSAAGKDVFAECAGLGSFEGVYSSAPPSTTTYSSNYRSGATDGSTHFQTQPPSGFWINKSVTNAYFWPGNFASPLLQLGDFPFKPLSGAIQNYQASLYKTETSRLVSDGTPTPSAYDVFTLVPASPSHGTVVYLGGHSYSGTDGPFQIAGSRLVLNTLFNLGAACVESGVACNTGSFGVCAQGTMRCDPATGAPACIPTSGPTPEICDGADNDCDGLVDEGLDTACYDGATATRGVGICHDGVRSCVRDANGNYGMSACNGQVLPSPEVCNGLDDDCNTVVDDAPVVPPAAPVANSLAQACYTGPQSSLDPSTGFPRGICKAGVQTCSGGVWGACDVCPANAWLTPASFPGCQILPQTETCGTDGQGNQIDMNCNGIVADGCGCTPGATQPCYRGPSGTLGVGACKAGTQTCQAGTPASWGTCSGDVLPGPLDCTKPPATPPADANCNSVPDYQEPACNLCPPAGDPSLVCYDGPAGTLPTAPGDPRVCSSGVRACSNGVLGTCGGQILPSPEVCDGRDNDCNGTVDDGASCGAGLSCVNGACVPSTCGVEQLCPEGYACATGTCQLAPCGAAPCAQGAVCRFGLCADPCQGVTCGAGTVCASGTCTAGGCYNTGCPSGQLCRNGACVTDPCVGVGGDTCPSGTFCRAGDCVQACTFQTCPTGQRCGIDGFCVADPCSGVSCAPDQLCEGGACVPNPCLGVSCGPGLVCQAGACVDDPCAGIRCPAGQCLGGQCYSTENPQGVGPTPTPPAAKNTSGCGCGSGAGSALSALLLLAALPLARRRRGPSAQPRALLILLAAVALGGAACKDQKDPFDPSQCKETCGEQRCVDLARDPVHCATCGSACATGQICVDAVCGPAGAIAPYISSSDRQSAPKGAITTVVLTGERFAAGATVRTISAAGTQTYPANVTSASQLSADLDFTASATTHLSLRVVNPDRVISNAYPFDVVTPTPVITALTPIDVPSGTTQTFTVTGTGFVPSSQCHVKGPTTTDLALPSVSGASVTCDLDSAGLPAGAYELWVVNEGTLASNRMAFQITGTGSVTLTALSPSAAASGDVIALLVTGTGFDPTSVVTFDGANQTTTFQDPTHLLVPALTVPTCATTCTHAVSVTLAGNALTFTVSATAPRADTMNVSPTPPYQGDTVTLTFAGANLGGATGGTVQPPVGPALTATLAGPPTATSAAVTVSLAGQPAGLYTATLTFPTGPSSAFQFRVLSSAAVLQSASPAGGAQGTSPVVTFTGSNLRGTSGTVLFQGPGGFSQSLPAATWTAPNGATVTLNLAGAGGGLDTGVYSLALINTGATASNQVSFSVTPGLPTVATVSPASVSQGAAPPVTVTLAGTNFAKPDANGNAASQVMVLGAHPAWAPATAYAVGALVLNGDNTYRCITAGTSAGAGPGPTGTAASIADGTVTWTWAGTWAPLPAGNVVSITSSTSIAIQFDPRTAVPGSYLLQVWNPPGPQKSGSVAFSVTP